MIASDGAGGAIVTWNDYRSGPGDIYAQRVNAFGVAQWTADGVALCTLAGDQTYPTIVADGSGGAIVTWNDFRSTSYDIYAQRVNASGVVQWTANGVALCTAANHQESHSIASDGAGGAIVTWNDYRSGPADIYAQRVNAFGVAQWTADGVALCVASDMQWGAKIVSDGAGGAIVTWEDSRSDPSDIYAQRVNASGVAQWPTNGIPICTAVSSQFVPMLVSDGLGGAILTWRDFRNQNNDDIYAQRVSASGVVQWTNNGVAVCTAANVQYYTAIAADGSGGAIVMWSNNGTGDIYAQRLNGVGVAQWTGNGVALCTAADNQVSPAIVSDESGGAIVTWEDYRGGAADVYAQRVDGTGRIPTAEPSIISIVDIGNDQGREVKIRFARSGMDDPDASPPITRYVVFRRDDVPPATVQPSSRALLEDGWTQVGSVDAFTNGTYGVDVPTIGDSTAALGQYYSTFFIRAATDVPATYFDSPPDSGYSLDNLAPGIPSNLVYTGGQLSWDESTAEDFDYFTVYGATTDEDFGSATVVGYTVDPKMDIGVAAFTPYAAYFVTATDFSGNEGSPARINTTSDVGGPPKSYVLSVSNFPNPFNPETTVKYTVPSRAPVTIAVYDVRGTRVATLLDKEERAAGAYRVEWDGRADDGVTVSSGVYFARIEHNGATQTKKMLLLK